MMDRYVHGKLMKSLPRVNVPTVLIEPVAVADADGEPVPRGVPPHLPEDERRDNFREVELSYCEQAALGEARRCLRCDLEYTQAR